MSGDQLEALAAQADATDAPPPEGGADPTAPPADSPNVGALVFLLSTFVHIGSMALGVESLHRTLTAANIDTTARALAPIADKYGINLATAFDGPELVALMTAGPILWTAGLQLHHELKAKRAKPVDEPAPETVKA